MSNVESFDTWARTYYGRVYAYARRLSAKACEAEDLTQHGLVAVWRKWHTLRAPAAAVAYAEKAMYNEAARLWRSRRDWTIPLAFAPEPAASATDSDSTVTLDSALRELRPVERAVLAYRFLDDLTQAETARRLRKSIRSVKRWEASGRAKLALRLADTYVPGKPPVARIGGRSPAAVTPRENA